MKDNKRKIAIIGASYLQDPLIEKAKSMGIETHVFAWAANDIGERSADFFYPISITEKEKILEKCIEIGIDGICSIASDLAVNTVNFVADKMGLVGNSLESVYKSTNKANMRKAFSISGDPSPNSVQIGSIDELDSVKMCYPLIVKPVDRSGSRGVSEITDVSLLSEAVNGAIKHSFVGKAIVEEFFEGKEYSVECISYKGKHTLLAVTEKYTTGMPNFIETGHLEPAVLDKDLLERVERIVYHALDTLEIEYGASHSEIKIDNGSIKIVEIGARMGGDLIGSTLVPISTGVDYVRAVIQIALGEEPDLTKKNETYACGIRFILNADDLAVFHIIETESPDMIVASDIPDAIDRSVTDSSNRHGYFVLKSSNRDKIEEYLPGEMENYL